MQEYEEENRDFEQDGAGWWIQKIGILVYVLIIVAYAIQTWQLVSWLFPDDNWFMRIVTVFVCDGCATGYAMAEMFYRFRLHRTKHLVFGMWIVTFILATSASVIQMYLSSTHNIPHVIDGSIISVAYGLVIFAFVVNIVTITIIIRGEYGAAQPVMRYLDDKPKGRKPVQQPVQLPTPLARDVNVRSILDAMDVPADHMDEVIERLIKKGVLQPLAPKEEPAPSPLAMPNLDTASQNGNGKH